MSASRRYLLHCLHRITRRLNDGMSLQSAARLAGQTPFMFHRAFQRLTGETLKQYTLRVRLERAAGNLVTTDKEICVVAADAGFASHEVFTRAFRRHFGLTPRQYRLRGSRGAPKSALMKQRQLINAIGPCIRLYGPQLLSDTRRFPVPLLSITRKEIPPTPFLFVCRQASHSEISQKLAECFGIVYPHCVKAGLEMAGFPIARYPVVGPLMTIEAGVPLVKPARPEGEMEYCELPGGPVVLAIHGGPYDQLDETHAAALRWIQDQKLRVGGPHWEWYVTDPDQHPDPADWRTHIYYPLAH
jgi:AraC family transcriptional regulator